MSTGGGRVFTFDKVNTHVVAHSYVAL